MSDHSPSMVSRSDELQANTRVRLIDNPVRTGRIGTEHMGSGRRRVLQVYFDDGTEDHYPPSSLEEIHQTTSYSPYAWFSENRFAQARALRTAITHHRLSGRLANLIYSLNTTNTDFYPHQFKPVLQLLESPSNGILIADEVGLGKTIEAGLIWTELKARIDARRLLVVCPAVLRTKWKEELLNRFGVRAELVDANELLERLQQVANKPGEEFALIASMQGLRPPKNYEDNDNQRGAAKLARYLEQSDQGTEHHLHLLIIDEAHYLRNSVTSTNTLGMLLRPHTEYLALLSATPLQTSDTDLYNLLKLLDESAFPHEHSYQTSMSVTRPIVQLRDAVLAGSVNKKEFIETVNAALNNPFLEDSSQLQAMRANPPSAVELKTPAKRAEIADRLDRVNPLSKVVTRTLKREVQENRVIRVPQDFKATLSEIEKEFYEQVTHRVRHFCEIHGMLTGFILTTPQRQMASSMPAACRAWQEKLNKGHITGLEEALYELSSEDVEETDTPVLGTLVEQLMLIANSIGSYEELKANDTKYQKLEKNLRSYTQENPGEKIVLFSFFRQTLAYLKERLTEAGFSCIILQGGDDKDETLAAFKDEAGPQILLSSEVGSEGVDLQFSSLLINYDLPWNPMRIEQRIGRIDRLGQKADRILIWNLMYEDTIDERIYDRLLLRLDIFRETLGNMESIMGQVINKLTRELFSHQLTPEEELQRIEQNLQAIEENRLRHKKLEKEAPNLVAHGEFITGKVRAARELGRYISSEDLFAYVSDFITEKYPATRLSPVDNTDNLYSIEPDPQLIIDFGNFISAKEIQGQTRILSGSPLPLLFENRHKTPSPLQERITQEHPLVRFVSHYSNLPEYSKERAPVTAVEVSANSLFEKITCGVYVFTVFRWSFTGAHTSERLVYACKELTAGTLISAEDAERLVNHAALQGKNWFASSNILCPEKTTDAYYECREFLHTRYTDTKTTMENENNDRVNLQINLLTSRYKSDVERIKLRIYNYQQSGRVRTIPMEQGKIKKATERYELQLRILESKKTLEAASQPVIAGVIKVS